MQIERIHVVKEVNAPLSESVVYWMRCEHRSQDNWALLYALQKADEKKLPFVVLFSLAASTPNCSYRQKKFLFDGLEELKCSLEKHGIFFVNADVETPEELAERIKEMSPHLLVTDHSSLKPQRKWLETVAYHTLCSVVEVDGRNVVPLRAVSDKQEYAARTIRPKIHRMLEQFLVPFPSLSKLEGHAASFFSDPLTAPLAGKDASTAVSSFVPGEKAARTIFSTFVKEKVHQYLERNDPTKDALSNLSPYLHFGMISAQRIVLDMLENKQVPVEAKEVFLEELVVRRELADNFCFFNPHYDSPQCFPQWAQKTLAKHRADPREHVYSLKEFEEGNTHDSLWNAAQWELVHQGKMHGYMRMYWAKKILEWTATPEDAMRYAIYLNDTYSLDGVDANGYTGMAWSIGGVHDRPWRERAIFGTVRYMNYAGAKRKFKVDVYIQKIAMASGRLLT